MSEEEITCKICHAFISSGYHYKKCKHTICLDCYKQIFISKQLNEKEENLFKYLSEDKEYSTEMKCFDNNCKEKEVFKNLVEIENLTFNSELNKKIEDFKKENDKKILCQSCEKNDSEVECKKCESFICKNVLLKFIKIRLWRHI